MSNQNSHPDLQTPIAFDGDHRHLFVGSGKGASGHILHCNYYNNYLQRTIWYDAREFASGQDILIGAGAEQAYYGLSRLFADLQLKDIAQKKHWASHFYSWQGLGALDFSSITEKGGEIATASQHYAEGWRLQFGNASEPVGLLTQGWISGAASAIFGMPLGAFVPSQSKCAAVGPDLANVFRIVPGKASFPIYDGKAALQLSAKREPVKIAPNNIDEAAVMNAVFTLPLFGSPKVAGGLIKQFDVMISWLPHLYYDRVSFECIHEGERRFGVDGREAVEVLLEEAGHRCAFRTFGGIWRSMEWAAVVEPMCKTREDWVHGMGAIANCAGWGRIECTRLTKDEAEFVVHDDYESVGYTALYGKAAFAPSYLLKGGFRGIMNLVYNGDIQSKPMLTEEYYNRLCQRPDAFVTDVVKSAAQGSPVSVFHVHRRG
ncbi:MAG: hypothetical protein FD175_378 [Beijerinckiaceae bacterium]|nr:MAG: hypothetical protein FD175_378 [Beijerinckiaceae bacterium]